MKKTCDLIEGTKGDAVGQVLDQVSLGLDLYCGTIPDVYKIKDTFLDVLSTTVDGLNAVQQDGGPQPIDYVAGVAKTLGPAIASAVRFVSNQLNPVAAVCKAQLPAKLASLAWGLGESTRPLNSYGTRRTKR